MSIKAGFIYILVHPSDSNLIKVGITTRDPEVRLKEHNTQLDKAAGKVVESTCQKWMIKEFYFVKDVYNAESVFFHRSPLTEIPHAMHNELIKLDDRFITWEWVNKGLEMAKSVGVRKDLLNSPIPKTKSLKGAKWVESQLKDSGLRPLKGFGNGMTKVEFECHKGHVFKLDGRTLAKFPFCPICDPDQFDAYALGRVE